MRRRCGNKFMKKKLLFYFLVIIFTSAVVHVSSIGKEKETKKSTSHEYKK